MMFENEKYMITCIT